MKIVTLIGARPQFIEVAVVSKKRHYLKKSDFNSDLYCNGIAGENILKTLVK